MTETVIAPVLLSASEIAARPVEPLGDNPDVTRRVVWRTDRAEAGILHVPGGGRLGSHAHRVSHHHMWVLDGAADILGRHLVKGSYVHVPVGVEHDIDATATDGCTVLYVYAPDT